MKLHRLSLIALALAALPAASASAVVWHDVDSDFHITAGGYNFNLAGNLYTYTVTAYSDFNYSNVHLVFPFAYTIDRLPPSTSTIFPWNDVTHQWENGGNFIDIWNVNAQQTALVLMSNTDIPLTDASAPPPTPSTILATDSVPIISLGNFTAGIGNAQTFQFQTLMGSVAPNLEDGFFVVPEPATLGVLALGAMGLLARRRR